MTWTWNDDDPATSASAQNFNTHIENRLRALEAGGGGLTIGADHRREGEAGVITAIANFDQITPADPANGVFVSLEVQNPTGGAGVFTLESWFGDMRSNRSVPAGGLETAQILLGPGETYYVSSLDTGLTVTRLVEKSLS